MGLYTNFRSQIGKSVVVWISNSLETPWRFQLVLRACRNICGMETHWTLAHVRRSRNDAVDALAMMGIFGINFIDFVYLVFLPSIFFWLVVYMFEHPFMIFYGFQKIKKRICVIKLKNLYGYMSFVCQSLSQINLLLKTVSLIKQRDML